ncbi:uncharacterized protein LOC62_04G005332 [Vanrija pseudolonga]|uniref:Uncharacterized protein n=1 Tax=Vanrija pseudolonga TaxID=143232 RepID=A0AAF0YBM0_9TREE|nr:hypothetical protein LOC62_04G005332 [Vanrija pseudolonga]
MDHTAFPDRIDRILVFAPDDTLLPFRGTSKAYFERCNRMLLSHVALTWVSRQTLSEEPVIQRHQYSTIDPEGAFILTSTTAPTRRLPFLPEHVKIIDLMSDGPRRQLLQLCTHLHTIRRRGSPGRMVVCLPSPATVVDYIDLRATPGEATMLVAPPDGPAERIVHLNAVGPLIPGGRISIPYGTVPNTFPVVVTLVLWPPCGTTVSAIPDLDVNLILIILRAIFIMWDEAAPVSVTVVGMENHLQSGVPLPNGEQFTNNLVDRFVARTGKHPDLFTLVPPLRAALDSGTRLITRTEWLQELGDRKDVLAEPASNAWSHVSGGEFDAIVTLGEHNHSAPEAE